MEKNKLRSIDDIVFEEKNKSYGAYDLRKTEKKYLNRSFLIGSIIFVLFVLFLFFYNNWQASRKANQKSVIADLQNIDTPPEKEEDIIEIKPEEEPPPPPPQQDEVAQVKMVIPEVKKIVVNEEPPPKVEETKDKAIGLENKDGRATTDAAIAHGPKNDVPPAPIPPRPVDDNKVFDKVEVEAEYPGGMNSLRDYVQRNIEYPERALDNGTQGKVMIKFVVEKDGTVSNLQAIRDIGDGCGAEVIRVLKRTKKWKPAMVDGKPVRSYYRFPIDFRLPS